MDAATFLPIYDREIEIASASPPQAQITLPPRMESASIDELTLFR